MAITGITLARLPGQRVRRRRQQPASANFGYQTNWKTFSFGGKTYLLFKYRIMDPETGVFLSRDLAGTQFGLNEYRAFSNSPVAQIDENGLQAVEELGEDFIRKKVGEIYVIIGDNPDISADMIKAYLGSAGAPRYIENPPRSALARLRSSTHSARAITNDPKSMVATVDVFAYIPKDLPTRTQWKTQLSAAEKAKEIKRQIAKNLISDADEVLTVERAIEQALHAQEQVLISQLRNAEVKSFDVLRSSLVRKRLNVLNDYAARAESKLSLTLSLLRPRLGTWQVVKRFGVKWAPAKILTLGLFVVATGGTAQGAVEVAAPRTLQARDDFSNMRAEKIDIAVAALKDVGDAWFPITTAVEVGFFDHLSNISIVEDAGEDPRFMGPLDSYFAAQRITERRNKAAIDFRRNEILKLRRRQQAFRDILFQEELDEGQRRRMQFYLRQADAYMNSINAARQGRPDPVLQRLDELEDEILLNLPPREN